MAPKGASSIRTSARLSSKGRQTSARGAGKMRLRARLPARWIVALAVLAVVWLALMILASYLSYEHKLPVRIEHWKPTPAR